MVSARGWGKGEKGTEFQFGRMNIPEVDKEVGCTMMRTYLTPLNHTLRNG